MDLLQQVAESRRLDPAANLFEAAVAASRALFGDKGILDDPNIVRRFSTETPIEYYVFAPFVMETLPLSSIADEVKATTADNVDEHRESIAEWLGSASPDLSGVVTSGATVLLYAILIGDVELAQMMLDLGADPVNSHFLKSALFRSHTMRHGFPLTVVAAAVGRVDMLRALCLAGATPMCHDRWGRTPLHAAAAFAHYDAIQYLVENSDVGRSTCDRDSKRAVDYLPSSSPKELRQMLTPVEVPRCNLASLKGEKAPMLHWCHCRGVPQPCSCPDAFFERWYMDRANSSWLPVDVVTAMNAMHKKAYGAGNKSPNNNN
eukprot:PhM_4_TR150/c0_g1_i1/m.7797